MCRGVFVQHFYTIACLLGQWARLRRLAAQASGCKSAAHARSLLAVTPRPENIFFMKDGRMKLGDFGEAQGVYNMLQLNTV